MFNFLKEHLKKAAEEIAKRVKGEGAGIEETKPDAEGKKDVIGKKADIRKKPDVKEIGKGEAKIKLPETEKKEEPEIEEKYEREEKKSAPGKGEGLVGRLIKTVTEKRLTEDDIDSFFSEHELELLQDNVAVEVLDHMKASLKRQLAGKDISRMKTAGAIYDAFYNSIFEAVNNGSLDLEEMIRKAKREGRPAVILFLGFNGSGKTTSTAKVAGYLESKGHKVVLAAADTFRAAAIDQLEKHALNLKTKIIKTQYGHDPAAVVFDAVQFAKAKGYDAVLADTAGRTHINKNLIDELVKIIRVNKPDLKILVVDSLTGNDAVEQAKTFDKAVGIDGCILTKVDVNEKGGAILSVSYAVKKPILFLGTGQGYDDIELFEPEKFVKGLLE